MTHAAARALVGPALDDFVRLSDEAAEREVPDPGGYIPVSAPAPDPERPRPQDRIDALKRETIQTLKEIGRFQTGKTPDYEWAFWAAHSVAQRLGLEGGMAIDEEADEKRLVAVHNKAVEILRKEREKEAASGGAPFRRDPERVAPAA